MATTTIFSTQSTGSYVAYGITTSFNDGDTIDTGLINVDWFDASSNTADTVVTMTSQAAGVVTAAGKTAGSAASGVTVYWEARIRLHKA